MNLENINYFSPQKTERILFVLFKLIFLTCLLNKEGGYISFEYWLLTKIFFAQFVARQVYKAEIDMATHRWVVIVNRYKCCVEIYGIYVM